MPELPEVETIVRAVRPRLVGRTITAFTSRWAKNAVPSVAAVRAGIVGQRIERVARRAKFVVFHLEDGSCVLIHLRMSGRLEWDDAVDRPAHVRAAFALDDGRRLLFCDARKFGRIRHANSLAEATAGLGPEPLSRGFTVATLQQIVKSRKRQLKPLLLDQSVIAGLGNIYTDEALHRAGLHPLLSSQRLTRAQVTELHAAIRDVLRMAIRNHGTSIDWIYPDGWMQARLMVYGRAGEPCRNCHTPIEALRVGQRGTYICPRCQRRSRQRNPAARESACSKQRRSQ
jgi:formamidopyrimidine-DNA glycosylase